MPKTKVYSNKGQKVKELSGPTIRGNKYPAGTIVTNDPNDPRLQAYQDSLDSYHYGEKEYQHFLQDFNRIKEKEDDRMYKSYLKRVPEKEDRKLQKPYTIYENNNAFGHTYTAADSPERRALAPKGNIVRKTSILPISTGYYTSTEKDKNDVHKPTFFDQLIGNVPRGGGVWDMWYSRYKKPVQQVVYDSTYQPNKLKKIITPKPVSELSSTITPIKPLGLPIPTITPNERIMPDVIYRDNNIPNAAYNKGMDIYHRTDGLGRWVAELSMSTQPGIRGRISTPNPKGNYTKIYKYRQQR